MQGLDIDINNITAADAFSNQSQERTHCVAYLILRQAVTDHIQSKQEPELTLCQKPNATFQWQPDEDALHTHREMVQDLD